MCQTSCLLYDRRHNSSESAPWDRLRRLQLMLSQQFRPDRRRTCLPHRVPLRCRSEKFPPLPCRSGCPPFPLKRGSGICFLPPASDLPLFCAASQLITEMILRQCILDGQSDALKCAHQRTGRSAGLLCLYLRIFNLHIFNFYRCQIRSSPGIRSRRHRTNQSACTRLRPDHRLADQQVLTLISCVTVPNSPPVPSTAVIELPAVFPTCRPSIRYVFP